MKGIIRIIYKYRYGLAGFIGFLILLVFRTQQFSGDSQWYAYNIRHGESLFHPHHLVFMPFIHLIYRICQFFTASVDTAFLAQFHNAFFAGVSLYVFLRILELQLEKEWLRWTLALSLFFSYGFWHFSTQVEVYIPALAFHVLILYNLIKRDLNQFPVRRIIVLSFLLAMAVLYHQTSILFCIPMMYVFYAAGGKKTLLKGLAVFVISGSIVALAYFFALPYEGLNRDFNDFYGFVFKYARAGDTEWGTLANYSFSGLLKVVMSQVSNFIQPLLAKRTVYLIFFSVIFMGPIIIALIKKVRVIEKNRHHWLLNTLLIWLLVHFTFFLWWLPQETEFFIISLVPWILLMAIILQLVENYIGATYYKYAIMAFPLILFALNVGSFHRSFSVKSNSRLQAETFGEISNGECLPLTDFSAETAVQYYLDINSINVESILSYLYRDMALFDKWDIKEIPCLIIHTKYLYPDRLLNGFSGQTHPVQWNGFLYWLFDFNENQTHPRKFELINKRGEVYILLCSEKVKYPETVLLFEKLDAEFADSGLRNPALSNWYRTKTP